MGSNDTDVACVGGAGVAGGTTLSIVGAVTGWGEPAGLRLSANVILPATATSTTAPAPTNVRTRFRRRCAIGVGVGVGWAGPRSGGCGTAGCDTPVRDTPVVDGTKDRAFTMRRPETSAAW
jgi:hypothetical protein